jgi:hypothetical protein
MGYLPPADDFDTAHAEALPRVDISPMAACTNTRLRATVYVCEIGVNPAPFIALLKEGC